MDRSHMGKLGYAKMWPADELKTAAMGRKLAKKGRKPARGHSPAISGNRRITDLSDPATRRSRTRFHDPRWNLVAMPLERRLRYRGAHGMDANRNGKLEERDRKFSHVTVLETKEGSGCERALGSVGHAHTLPIFDTRNHGSIG